MTLVRDPRAVRIRLTMGADIYGSAEIKASVLSAENSARIAANTRTEIHMTVTDTLYSYGSLRGGVIGTINEEVSGQSSVTAPRLMQL